jgi:hypothetical protein
MIQDPSRLSDDDAEPIRLGIADAAVRLGVSPDTVRRRVKRGQLEALRDNTGKLWVTLSADLALAPPPLHTQPAAYAPMQHDQSSLVDELRSHVASLRNELDLAHAERDRLLTMLEHLQAVMVYREQGFLKRLWQRLTKRGQPDTTQPSWDGGDAYGSD